MTKITPGINKILVIPDEYAKTFADSILLIPDNKKKINNFGTVVAVGKLEEPYSLYPEGLKAGDHVMWHPDWSKMQGYEIEIDKKTHYIFHVELILGRC